MFYEQQLQLSITTAHLSLPLLGYRQKSFDKLLFHLWIWSFSRNFHVPPRFSGAVRGSDNPRLQPELGAGAGQSQGVFNLAAARCEWIISAELQLVSRVVVVAVVSRKTLDEPADDAAFRLFKNDFGSTFVAQRASLSFLAFTLSSVIKSRSSYNTF
ncbi:unnamed protein product [Leptosia nina]|uniref:Uncharacterized protein n=1 Tax=Leptosia nina TaxID=320188 RepID=A0AAV1JQ38_9NEOP